MAISFMRNASGHNCRNSSFIVDVAIGQIPRSTERISSFIKWPTACWKQGRGQDLFQPRQMVSAGARLQLVGGVSNGWKGAYGERESTSL